VSRLSTLDHFLLSGTLYSNAVDSCFAHNLSDHDPVLLRLALAMNLISFTNRVHSPRISWVIPSVLWRCWLGGRKGIRPVKTEWWVAGVVICLEQGADLHMAQLMPMPLTVSCFSKIQIGFTFLVPAHPGSPGQRAGKRVCVCISWVKATTQDCCNYKCVVQENLRRIVLPAARLQLSIDIFCPHGAHRRDRQTDGRTLERYVDPTYSTYYRTAPIKR